MQVSKRLFTSPRIHKQASLANPFWIEQQRRLFLSRVFSTRASCSASSQEIIADQEGYNHGRSHRHFYGTHSKMMFASNP